MRPYIKDYFSNILKTLDLSEDVFAILSIAFTGTAIWLAMQFLRPAPPIPWSSLNPDDQAAMKKGFKSLRICTELAKMLDEDIAETEKQFVEQIRKFKLFGKHSVWDRIDLNNPEQIAKLFEKKDIVRGVAEKINKQPATSISDFRNQINLLRTGQ